jgi:3-oxoacyl-[acyl-carrier protein] reductase
MTSTVAAQHGALSGQEYRHAGKVAVVTGGARGIGAGIVRRLAAEGARVTFTYASAQDEADALAASVLESGGYAAGIRVDSADRAEIREAITSVASHEGRLDIVVSKRRRGDHEASSATI